MSAPTTSGSSSWGTDKYALSGKKWSLLFWQYGGGGGISSVFGVPGYQSDVASGGRTVPDVSMVGDPNTGMLVGQTQTFPDGTYYDEFRLGGTSLSSPLLAGLMAVADQAAGQPAGDVRVDYVNGVDDTDGAVTSLRAFGDTLTLHSVPGYDDANGWGTPNASFISAISNY